MGDRPADVRQTPIGEVMERTPINPVAWSKELGFNQGEVVAGHTRTLYISGQTAMDSRVDRSTRVT